MRFLQWLCEINPWYRRQQEFDHQYNIVSANKALLEITDEEGRCRFWDRVDYLTQQHYGDIPPDP